MNQIINRLEKESTEYKERAKKIAAKLQGDAMIYLIVLHQNCKVRW